MKIIIFPEKLVFKHLRTSKKKTMEMFKEFYLAKNLTIIFMVENIQSFCSQTHVAGLKFQKFHLVTSELANKNLEVKDLKKAITMVGGDVSRVTLVSHNDEDALSAKKLGIAFVLVGVPKKRRDPKIVTNEVIKDLSLLPQILGLTKKTLN